MQKKNVIIILPKREKKDYYKYQFDELMRFILEEYKNKIKFEQKKDIMKLLIINNYSSPEDLLNFLIKFSNDVANHFGVNKSVKQ